MTDIEIKKGQRWQHKNTWSIWEVTGAGKKHTQLKLIEGTTHTFKGTNKTQVANWYLPTEYVLLNN